MNAKAAVGAVEVSVPVFGAVLVFAKNEGNFGVALNAPVFESPVKGPRGECDPFGLAPRGLERDAPRPVDPRSVRRPPPAPTINDKLPISSTKGVAFSGEVAAAFGTGENGGGVCFFAKPNGEKSPGANADAPNGVVSFSGGVVSLRLTGVAPNDGVVSLRLTGVLVVPPLGVLGFRLRLPDLGHVLSFPKKLNVGGDSGDGDFGTGDAGGVSVTLDTGSGGALFDSAFLDRPALRDWCLGLVVVPAPMENAYGLSFSVASIGDPGAGEKVKPFVLALDDATLPSPSLSSDEA